MMESERETAMPEKMTTSKCARSAGASHSDVFSLVHNVYFCRVCSCINEGTREV